MSRSSWTMPSDHAIRTSPPPFRRTRVRRGPRLDRQRATVPVQRSGVYPLEPARHGYPHDARVALEGPRMEDDPRPDGAWRTGRKPSRPLSRRSPDPQTPRQYSRSMASGPTSRTWTALPSQFASAGSATSIGTVVRTVPSQGPCRGTRPSWRAGEPGPAVSVQ